MCGIAAIFAYGPGAAPVDANELSAIHDAMRARGPDDDDIWFSTDRRVGMSHRRLAIIDLSPSGHQPMTSEDGARVITFNGEIYNFMALRRQLEAEGRRFRSQSDTEVLLHLYERDGAEMVRHLRGMYAFALWDARKGGMLLARDPLGIKPLYYADDGVTLRAASQVKALRAGGRIGAAASPAGHVGFFLWGHVPEPFTLYRAIHALPAGSTLWVDGKGPAEPRRFWRVRDILAAANPRRPTVDALRALLSDSVKHHFVADTPVGLFLSAGLDSATLAAFSAVERGADLRTLTLGFDVQAGSPLDETPAAERLACALGTRHETRRVARGDFAAARDALFAAMDQPTIDGINTYFVARAAKDIGLKVALSGLGGDEMFAGYASFQQVPRTAAAFAPFRCAPFLGRGFRYVSTPLLRHATSPKYAGLLEYGGSYGGAYLLRRGLFMPWELPSILDGEMVREGWRALEPLAALEETVSGLATPRLKVTALETCWYMRNQLLRDADWAGMAHSIEIRVPFVDSAFLEGLAPLLASARPPTKRDLAAAVPRPLPAEILARPKSGFVVPVRDWLSHGFSGAGERGLRGWARQVHEAAA